MALRNYNRQKLYSGLILGVMSYGLFAAIDPAQAQFSRINVTVDNDHFNYWQPSEFRSDRDYSNGLQFTLTMDRLPFWARWVPRRYLVCESVEGACGQTTLILGQSMYTPEHDSSTPIFGHRPFAGWLFATYAGEFQYQHTGHRLGITLGVTGPPSLAEYTQRAIHVMTGYRQFDGWRHQLGFEPGLQIGYRASWNWLEQYENDLRWLSLSPRMHASVGNVRTDLQMDMMGRLGYNLPTPIFNQIENKTRISFYLEFNLSCNLVWRDLFLDGNTFSDQRWVNKENLVYQSVIGAHLRLDRIILSYVTTSQTKTYHRQREPHQYSSFQISIINF